MASIAERNLTLEHAQRPRMLGFRTDAQAARIVNPFLGSVTAQTNRSCINTLTFRVFSRFWGFVLWFSLSRDTNVSIRLTVIFLHLYPLISIHLRGGVDSPISRKGSYQWRLILDPPANDRWPLPKPGVYLLLSGLLFLHKRLIQPLFFDDRCTHPGGVGEWSNVADFRLTKDGIWFRRLACSSALTPGLNHKLGLPGLNRDSRFWWTTTRFKENIIQGLYGLDQASWTT